jgi:hypothetical protein
MKKISTAGGGQTRNFQDRQLTIGLDLADRWSWYCVLEEAGEVLLKQKGSLLGSSVARLAHFELLGPVSRPNALVVFALRHDATVKSNTRLSVVQFVPPGVSLLTYRPSQSSLGVRKT